MNPEELNNIKRETIKQIRLIINSHLFDCSNYDKVIKGVKDRIEMTEDIIKSEAKDGI
jgi:hypothetical protein